MQLKEKVRAAMIAYRKRRGLSQQEFAERLGWTKQHVSNLETGRAGWGLEALEKVCQVFTVPVVTTARLPAHVSLAVAPASV